MTKFKLDIKTLLTIHTAFLYGQVLFAVVAFLITDKTNQRLMKIFHELYKLLQHSLQ
jgi:uncharacterized protein (UPF0218 family)